MGEAVGCGRVMQIGLGRMAGSRGEALWPMMLGSCMGAGETGAKLPELPGGDTERGVDSRSGEGIVCCMTGEWFAEEPEETEVVRCLRRLLPWLSWW